jgi:predicted nucleic acid-binding Zn ribbon protein
MAFTLLKNVLEKVLKENNFEGDIETYRIFALWEEIAGTQVAAHARPARISQGILYVEVNDPLWLTQLRYMKREILGKIERGIKKDLFTDLKFFLKSF